jgi:hypothetical protein
MKQQQPHLLIFEVRINGELRVRLNAGSSVPTVKSHPGVALNPLRLKFGREPRNLPLSPDTANNNNNNEISDKWDKCAFTFYCGACRGSSDSTESPTTLTVLSA